MQRHLKFCLCLATCVCLLQAFAAPVLGQAEARPNAAILALRESNPTTPAELVRAIRTTIAFHRYDEAEIYVQRLLELAPDERALIALHEEFGSAVFIHISQDTELVVEGREFALAVIDAAHRYATNPQRLKALVGQLADPSSDMRTHALLGLVLAQEAAVAPLLAELGDPQSDHDPERMQAVLIQIGQPAVEPLLGVLQSPDEDLKAAVIRVLGRIGSRDALAYLVRPLLDPQSGDDLRQAAARAFVDIVGTVPSASEAERYLADLAARHDAGRLSGPADETDTTRVWRWHEGASHPLRLPADLATSLTVSDLAGDLHALWPENIGYRRMFLGSLLESEKFIAGLAFSLPRGEGTAHARAMSEGVDVLEDLLAYSLDNDRAVAAMAVCEVLGDSGDLGLLVGTGGAESLLVQALRHPNRRVRFFAAQAVLKLDPTQPFAGSNDLTQALGYFARASARRRSLVGHPHAEHSHTLAGSLSGLGFQTDTAATGRDLFLQAVESTDCEFILISGAIDHPPVGELVQMLRKDHRTAEIPLGLMARSDELLRLEELAETYPPAAAFPFPTNEEALIFDIRRLLSGVGEHYVPPEERVAQANAALSWLGELASQSDRYGFYDHFRQEDAARSALMVPETSAQAANLLGLLATPDAQLALVELASLNARPIGQRRAAVAALEAAVERRGVLLTTDRILDQYDRYNASESLDTDTQELLGALLDTIEAPTATPE